MASADTQRGTLPVVRNGARDSSLLQNLFVVFDSAIDVIVRSDPGYFQYAPFIPIVGVGKARHTTWSMVTCKDKTRYWNYLEDV